MCWLMARERESSGLATMGRRLYSLSIDRLLRWMGSSSSGVAWC